MFPILGKALLHGVTSGAAGSLAANSIPSLIGQGIGSMANIIGSSYASGMGQRAFNRAAKVPNAVTGGYHLNSPMMQKQTSSTEQIQNQKELTEHQAEVELDLFTQKALVTDQIQKEKNNRMIENLTGITLGKNLGEGLYNLFYKPTHANRFKSRVPKYGYSNSYRPRRRRQSN